MKVFIYLNLIFSFSLFGPSVTNIRSNATWIKSSYLRGHDPITKKEISPKDIENLALRLKNHHIRYAYIFAGPFNKDGHLPDYPFSQYARYSIAILKRVYPDIVILPWIGGIQNKTVYLERTNWVKNAIADTVKLVKLMQVNGVHLDLEYVLYAKSKFNNRKLNVNDYGSYWVKFHEQLRVALPYSFISSVVVSTASGAKQWKYKHSLSEVKKLSSIIDQMSFMFYETSIMELQLYKDNLKEQIEHIKDLKNSTSNRTKYLIAIGIFNEEKKLESYRDLGFKNLPLTLKYLKEGEQSISQDTILIDGLAIYCEWMVTDKEWRQLKEYLI
jgi:hypothetical protein